MSFFDDIVHFGQAPALIPETGEPVGYAALAEAADSLGERLRGLGLVFLLADNCVESVVGYLACLRSRTPVALLSAGLHAELLSKLVDTYQPHGLWLPKARAAEIAQGQERFAAGGYALLEKDAPALLGHPDLALLVTTSGTTGSPKFVRQSRANVAANAESIAQYLEIGPGDRPITTLPMHYVYGLSVINSHLARGAAVVLTNGSPTEKRFWDLLRDQNASSLSGVPYTYEMLRRLRFGRMNLPSLKVLTQAGGRLDAAVVAELAGLCRQKGMRFYVMYGAAEATARMAYLPPERALEKPASIGLAIPGGELWLEGEDGQVIDRPGAVGELVYRGPNVTMGYATCREDLALGDERGGVLRTGDLAQRDEDGFFFIVGRRSHFIKVLGNRLNLGELEQLIRAQGIDCACAGEDDRLRIYLVDDAQTQRVTAFVQERTGLHHSTYRIIVLERIPRNEAGKITYAALP